MLNDSADSPQFVVGDDFEIVDMYEKPKFSLNQVDKAGDALRSDNIDDLLKGPNDPFEVLFNHRAAHSFPLNSIYVTLRRRAKKVDPRALVAQRLKRYESIMIKLARNPSMQLSQMQDIGGCRAVVQTMKGLNQLDDLYRARPLNHHLQGKKDYTASPKCDGYRGIHLIYRFAGRLQSKPWDKLRIEIQLRTRLQHSWATAVETVDTFTEEYLKQGKGSTEWREFFRLMGSAHAILENKPLVPETPTEETELKAKIKELEHKLDVIRTLRSWSHVTKHIQGIKGGKDFWYIIEIKPDTRNVHIQSFAADKRKEANAKYGELELTYKGSPNNVVLVSVRSLRSLQKTYPNYFADTQQFIFSYHVFMKQN